MTTASQTKRARRVRSGWKHDVRTETRMIRRSQPCQGTEGRGNWRCIVWCLENTERGPGSWSTVSKGEWYHTRSEGEAEARWYRVRRPWQGIWNLLGHDGKQQVEFRERNVLMRLTLSEHPLTAVGREQPQERQPTAKHGCHLRKSALRKVRYLSQVSQLRATSIVTT